MQAKYCYVFAGTAFFLGPVLSPTRKSKPPLHCKLRLPLATAKTCGILYANTVKEQGMSEGRKKLLGWRLKEARRGVSLSQGHVADTLGITRQSVSAWETGASCPSATQLAELSELYCMCAHSLLFGEAYAPLNLGAIAVRGATSLSH
ncbi:MAG: XRE family transcriptional regulator [Hyphomicrobiales bacterium]|nr:MAG: XRE family transcriptional regulator [Hyphomicrobiales bacterium]